MLSTDFRTTSLGDVNWTVTVISQRSLPPVLLTSPRITPPVHHHEREPPGGWTQGFQTAEVTFKVTQGHPYWCHLIGHIWFPISLQSQLCIYLTQFPRYYHLIISQNLKRLCDSEHIRFGGSGWWWWWIFIQSGSVLNAENSHFRQ